MRAALALCVALLPFAASADEDDGQASAARLIRALERDDYGVAQPILEGTVVKFGKKVAAKTLKKTCKKKGLSAALGISTDGDWTVTAQGDELLVHPGAADGLTTVLVLASDDAGWRLTEVRREFFTAAVEPPIVEEPTTTETAPAATTPPPTTVVSGVVGRIVEYRKKQSVAATEISLTINKGSDKGIVAGCTADVLDGNTNTSVGTATVTSVTAKESVATLNTTAIGNNTRVAFTCP